MISVLRVESQREKQKGPTDFQVDLFDEYLSNREIIKDYCAAGIFKVST